MLELEDTKADLTNTVKNIVHTNRDQSKGHILSEDTKQGRTAVPAKLHAESPTTTEATNITKPKGQEDAKGKTEAEEEEEKNGPKGGPGEGDESSEEEKSSFYEEIFYDAISESTFTPAQPEKVMSMARFRQDRPQPPRTSRNRMFGRPCR